MYPESVVVVDAKNEGIAGACPAPEKLSVKIFA
jgi:hypothetical protein